MLNIDFGHLNPLEQKIHSTIAEAAAQRDSLTIKEAAELCGCSLSKISKFVKKLGFQNYKQYISYVYGSYETRQLTDDLLRIQDFLKQFDFELLHKLIALIEEHERIILFGYGPTFLCLTYFAYKLRLVTNKGVIAVQDEREAESMMTANSLLLVFSVTGTFKSFSDTFVEAKARGCRSVFIVEEYNPGLLESADADSVIFLTQSTQAQDLLPYQKSRSLFFILIEEITRWFLLEGKL